MSLGVPIFFRWVQKISERDQNVEVRVNLACQRIQINERRGQKIGRWGQTFWRRDQKIGRRVHIAGLRVARLRCRGLILPGCTFEGGGLSI